MIFSKEILFLVYRLAQNVTQGSASTQRDIFLHQKVGQFLLLPVYPRNGQETSKGFTRKQRREKVKE